MKNLCFIFFCLIAPSAYSATFRADQTALVAPKDTGLAGWSWKCFIFNSSDVKIADTSANNPAGTSANTWDLNGVFYSTTMSQDFYVAWGAAYGGLYSTGSHNGHADWQPMGWISAYEVGGNEPQFSGTGPYIGGQPSNPDGTPANPTTNQPEVRSYKASITVSCPVGALQVKLFRIVGIEDSEPHAKMYDQVVEVAAGASRTITVTHTAPFSLNAVEVLENLAQDPELSPGSPDDLDKRYRPIGPLATANSTPQAAAPLTPGTPEVNNQKTAQAASDSQAAAAHNTMSTATTGASSKDISDLDKNLTEEMKRGTNQTKTSGDAIKNAIEDTNSILKDIKEGGAGDSTGGDPITVATADSLNFVASIPGRATTMGAALSGLVSSLGLGTSVGTGTLAYSFDFPMIGAQYVNLEMFSDLIASVREFLRWALTIMFVWQSFSILKESFSK